MTKWVLLIVILLSTGVLAQNPAPTPVPTPNQEYERQRREAERRQREDQYSRLNSINAGNAVRKPIPSSVLHDIKEIYRDTTSKERKSLQPDQSDLKKYKDFLQQKNTGIFRLIQHMGCGDSANVISVKEECLKYSMPGNGSFYSFRKNDYTIGRIADIAYVDNAFRVVGSMQHGIMTDLGIVDLESIRESSEGMKYLMDLKPSSDIDTAKSIARELLVGADKQGFHYRQELNAIPDMTYALRIIAYCGSFLRSFNGFVYDEFDFDKRVDITLAFKVIRKHADGSVTIIWKQIKKKNSPALKPEDDEDPKDFLKRFVARSDKTTNK